MTDRTIDRGAAAPAGRGAAASRALQAQLAHMLQPAHVAVIGASASPEKPGHVALRHLLAGGFPGRITAVNPRGGEALGQSLLPSIRETRGVDCAFLTIPAALVPAAVRDCAEAGVRTLVIGANGFAEQGTEAGRQRQAEIDAIAAAAGMRILGPNTNGIYNTAASLALGYNAAHGDPMLRGPVSVAAHSGALFDSFYPRLRQFGAGLSKFIPVGNEADLTMLDFLEHFVEDPDTRVIALIVESLTDMPRFRALAARAAVADKPVLALKLGRSTAGAASALAHSSRLAGSGRAYEALFRDSGVVEVASVEALAGAAALFAAHGPAPRPARPLIGVTTSGAGGALLADHAEARGLALAGRDGHWQGAAAEAAEGIEGAGLIRNPVDLGNLPDHRLLARLFAAQEAEGDTGPVAAFVHRLPTEEMDLTVARLLAERRVRVTAPVVVTAPGGLGTATEAAYRAAGVLRCADLGTAFDILRAWQVQGDRPAPGGEAVLPAGPRLPDAPGRAFLTEPESAAVLAAAGVPMAPFRLLAPADAAEAGDLGFPLVLKAIPPDETHKARLGFVHTGIADAPALGVAVAAMRARVAAQGYRPETVPLMLQPMVSGALELIAGVSHEPGLGHFLTLGLGGVTTELLDEVMLFPVPVAPERLSDTLARNRLGRLLVAAGGPAAVPAVTGVLVALQALAVDHADRLASAEVNPLILGADGPVGVDALIVLRGG